MGYLILEFVAERVSCEKFTGPEDCAEIEVFVKAAAVLLIEEEVRDPFEMEPPDCGEIDFNLIDLSPVVESGKSGLA